MPEMLVVSNPLKKINRKRKNNPIKSPVFTPALKRKKNPIPAELLKIKSPVLAGMKRKKNPIDARGMLDVVMQAIIGSSGAILNDVGAGYFAPTIGLAVDYSSPVYMAYKVVQAGVFGELLSAPTSGLSWQMASGAITVATNDYMRTVVKEQAPTMTLGRRTIPALSNMYVAGSPALAGYGAGNALLMPPAPSKPCSCSSTPPAPVNTLNGVGRGIGTGNGLFAGVIQTQPQQQAMAGRVIGGRGNRGRR